jgi:hypothetical protein
MSHTPEPPKNTAPEADAVSHNVRAVSESESEPSREIGGRGGPEPTRFGDWEKNGRCIDF